MLTWIKRRPPTGGQGFTLIELIVVISIIAVLAAATTFSYRASLIASRDARRKTDLEQIRAALELYKSNNNIYPVATIDCNSSGAFTDGGGNTYLSSIPKDPKCTTQSYYYGQLSAGADYTLGSILESPGSSTCTVVVDCSPAAGTQNCNYCVGPYGQK